MTAEPDEVVCNDHSDLIELDVFDAMRLKFERGRQAYGDQAWIGPPPLICSHDEIVDYLVYIDQAKQMGMLNDMMGHSLFLKAIDLRQGTQTAIRMWRDGTL